MVKHTQTIRRQFADELLGCVWPFYGIGGSRVNSCLDSLLMSQIKFLMEFLVVLAVSVIWMLVYYQASKPSQLRYKFSNINAASFLYIIFIHFYIVVVLSSKNQYHNHYYLPKFSPIHMSLNKCDEESLICCIWRNRSNLICIGHCRLRKSNGN